MLLFASGHLYNKIQNLERITKFKKKAKITVVPCQTRLSLPIRKRDGAGVGGDKKLLHYLLYENV